MAPRGTQRNEPRKTKNNLPQNHGAHGVWKCPGYADAAFGCAFVSDRPSPANPVARQQPARTHVKAFPKLSIYEGWLSILAGGFWDQNEPTQHT